MNAAAPALSSLIFTLTAHAELRAAAVRALVARDDLELGELRDRWLPAVLEADDPYRVFRELEALPGVELVEVVFVELPASPPA